jgi:hypothetical protein
MKRLIYFLSVLIGSFVFISLTSSFSTTTNLPYTGGDLVLNCNDNLVIDENIVLNGSANLYIVGSGGSINFTRNSSITGNQFASNLIYKDIDCKINMPRKFNFNYGRCGDYGGFMIGYGCEGEHCNVFGGLCEVKWTGSGLTCGSPCDV